MSVQINQTRKQDSIELISNIQNIFAPLLYVACVCTIDINEYQS